MRGRGGHRSFSFDCRGSAHAQPEDAVTTAMPDSFLPPSRSSESRVWESSNLSMGVHKNPWSATPLCFSSLLSKMADRPFDEDPLFRFFKKDSCDPWNHREIVYLSMFQSLATPSLALFPQNADRGRDWEVHVDAICRRHGRWDFYHPLSPIGMKFSLSVLQK